MSSYSFFSENTNYYYYSALLQANASILALIGVYATFKIQSLQTIIEIIWKFINRGYKEATDMVKLNDLLSNPIANKEEITDIINLYGENTFWGKWYEIALSIYSLKKAIIVPSISLCIGIIINMIGIIFSNYLHLLGFMSELIAIFFTALFELFTVLMVIRSILKYLK